MRTTLLTPAFVALLGGCGAHPAALRPVPASHAQRVSLCTTESCPDSVELTYLGVGGFVVRHEGRAVLTAPSFTHRALPKVLLPWSYPADTVLVNERMQEVARLDEVEAILVGHAHYDHLLDLPHVARRWTPGTRIYGSPTMRNTLAADSTLRPLVASVADSVADSLTTGRWIYADGGRLRFLPLRSTHAPNFWRITFSPGQLKDTLPKLPRTAHGWRMGEVYAWIIDVVAADSTPTFRMYYQDSAADSAHLVLPRFTGRDARQVDLAVLCVGNYGKVPNSPAVFLDLLQPRYVMLSHWENFFRSARDSLRVVPFTRTQPLVSTLDARMPEKWMTPTPGTRVTFRY